MGLAADLIGAGAGLASGIAGGRATQKAMKKIRSNIEDEQQKNQNWYDRRMNEDATQRADAQASLTALRDMVRNSNRSAAGTQAVMGGTEESVAATKAANANAMAQAASNIAVNADARKDAIENQYMETDRDLTNQLNNFEMQAANANAQAVQGSVNAAGNLINAFNQPKTTQMG